MTFPDPSASPLSAEALPEVRERFTEMGYGEEQLQAVLGWIQARHLEAQLKNAIRCGYKTSKFLDV